LERACRFQGQFLGKMNLELLEWFALAEDREQKPMFSLGPICAPKRWRDRNSPENEELFATRLQ
jgi:hypothetical protein